MKLMLTKLKTYQSDEIIRSQRRQQQQVLPVPNPSLAAPQRDDGCSIADDAQEVRHLQSDLHHWTHLSFDGTPVKGSVGVEGFICPEDGSV